MSAVRLFSPVALQANCQFTLDSGQFRYLTRVLRLHSGDALTLFDGSGGEYAAVLVHVSKNEAIVETGTLQHRSLESSLAIGLVQGISKGDRMDKVVQKVTELGVTQITPVCTDRAVIRYDAKRATRRQEHWQKIAQSACEQCGRNVIPAIEPVIKLSDWHDAHPANDLLRLVLKPGAPQTLSSISRPRNKATLLVGPEGGFSDAEYERAAAAGFEAISLGPRVLRTETAAMAAVSVVQALWGDLG